MADDDAQWSAPQEEYELVPYKEINELKDELHKLKDYPIPSSKKLQVTMDELALKLDRMTAILEEASHELHAEEGGMTFQEKMRPLLEKMNKILEQNSEIAKGIVAVADLVEELKGRLESGFMVKENVSPGFMPQEQSVAQMAPPSMQSMPEMGSMGPPMGSPMGQQPQPLPGVMPPPPPKKKGFF
jgi:hypothetical protein